MSNNHALEISHTSIHFKKVAMAIAKNKGVSFRRLFQQFAYDEIKKFDTAEYENPDIKTKRADFLIKNFPETLKLQLARVAKKNGLTINEFSMYLVVMLVNSAPKDMKVYLPDSED